MQMQTRITGKSVSTQRAVSTLLLFALVAISCASAQETTAGLQGTVRDSSGAVVINATIEVSSPALLSSRKTQTDGAGQYRIVALPPGQYSLTVTAAGFRTFRQ